jgi:3-hydroxyacyl-[acyl-carrier-protein] dehydratase/UDP-3-O-[3-hydroxymyristoyl] N-acetylglucosamine deacetylase/3-hydroxyacyl-[acyl-carrier-protein] dehydratase
MPQNQNRDSLNIEEILKILPHRYPFLLVDKVLEIKEGKRIVAVKNVTYNELFFQGHFPALRVMPGVLVLEAIGQAGGILLHYSLPHPEDVLTFLSKIDNAKFRKPVVPGDQLRLEVDLIKLKKNFGYVKGTALVNKDIVAECELMASFRAIGERDE